MPLLLVLSLLLACGDKDEASAPDVDEDGYAADVDCDDRNPGLNPGALEICDGVDNNCNELVDDDDPEIDTRSGSLFYLDADFDGYGDPDVTVTACLAPAGHSADGTDCDDGDEAINPGARELCDQVDNNCNDQVDEGIGGQVLYLDADGDGYGDPASEVDACSLIEGYITVGDDCDDGDAAVYPGAAELCDGIDTDCDEVVDSSGTVAFQAADGSWSDATETFGTGSRATSVSLDEAGTYWFCDGTWLVNLDLAADVELRGRSGDWSTVILDGNSEGSVVDVVSGARIVGLYDLTLQGGNGDGGGSYLSDRGGGGLACDSGASITGAGLRIADNRAYYGAGVAIYSCSLSLTDSEISQNSADSLGGGMILFDGEFTLDGVEITSNLATSDIGGIYLARESASTLLTMQDVVVADNQDYGTTGGIYVYNAQLDMSSSTSGASAITGNSSDRGYGALQVAYGTSTTSLRFTDVDFGSLGAADDNSIPEILHSYWMHEYIADGVRSFTCDSETCGSSTSYTLGSLTSSISVGTRLYGNMVEADSYALVDSFSTYISATVGCSADMYILSSSTTPSSSSTWDVVWSDTGVSVGAGGWISGDYVSVFVEPGMWYAFAVGQTCSGGDSLYYSSASGTSVGFGRHAGYVYLSSGGYLSSFRSTASLYSSTGSIQFAQYIGSTTL